MTEPAPDALECVEVVITAESADWLCAWRPWLMAPPWTRLPLRVGRARRRSAADIIAEHAGTGRDTAMDAVAPEMMNLTTGRLVDPQEAADVIALLVSPRSASTTGSDFVIDAGFLKAV